MPVTETKYPFDLKPIKISGTVLHVGFLTGDPAQEFLTEYNRRVSADYGNNRELAVLAYDKERNVITGSYPLAVVLVNHILRGSGLHVATQADLECVLRAGDPLGLRDNYEDTALVLRSEDDPNSYLAHDIATQIRERRGGELKFPVMVPLRYFEVENDNSSKNEFGLRFKLSDDAKIVYAPILNQGGNFSSVDEKTGLPTETGREGTRTLCTVESGLSWLHLGWDLDLFALEYCPPCDVSFGRVVVVRDGAEGATPQSAVRAYTLQDIETARKDVEEMQRVDANAGKNIEALLEKLKQ